MAVTKKVWTDEEILSLKSEGKVEIVGGELKIMTPAGLEQEDVGAILVAHLVNYVIPKKLGRIYMSQAGFRMPNGDLRAPDVSFVRTEKLPSGRSPKKFGHFPPDLAVEILAEDETPEDYAAKVQEYLDWGVTLVWVVDPNTHTVWVHRKGREPKQLTENDELDGEDVISGFRMPVRVLFE
ncbi:MAG: Uma2 family endonuclease [Armatimonadetes bacterium]|nr:Uma2 family endonuclease [Armatimonadota bacterium]